MSPTYDAGTGKPDFDAFLQSLRQAVRIRLAAEWKGARETIFRLGDAFVDRSRDDLARWTGLLSVGALTKADFDWLVQGRRELAELEALRAAGLTTAEADRLRAAVVETVVSTAFVHFLGWKA